MKQFNVFQKLVSLFFLGLVIFWGYIQISGSKDGDINFWYSFLFGLIPLVGGAIGMVRSKVWGGLRSTLGSAVFFVSLGLLFWGLGESVWAYYNFFKNVAAPYPSWADLGFAPSIFFWVIGVSFLSHASGAWLGLKRSWKAKTFATIAVAGLTVLSYFLLIRVARGNVLVPPGETALKVVLDILYPLGDFLAVILAFIVFTLSFKYLGGLYKRAIGAVLLGLGVMYVADFVFSYTTTVGSYYNANWGDLLLSTGLFLLTFGVLGLSTKPQLGTVNSSAANQQEQSIASEVQTPTVENQAESTAEQQEPLAESSDLEAPVETPAPKDDESSTGSEEK